MGKDELINQVDFYTTIDGETIVLGRNGKERFILSHDSNGKVVGETKFMEQYAFPPSGDKEKIDRFDFTHKYDLLVEGVLTFD